MEEALLLDLQVVEEEAAEHLFLKAVEEELQNAGMLVAGEVLGCWKLLEEEEEGLEVTSLV